MSPRASVSTKEVQAFSGTWATGAGWIVPKKCVERVGEDSFTLK